MSSSSRKNFEGQTALATGLHNAIIAAPMTTVIVSVRVL
jgi:hypothetical protein